MSSPTSVRTDDPPAVVLTGITKRFPGVVANSDVHLTVRRGEVHALCGENGAGKSTLMKILYGMQAPDEGTIEVNGEQVRFRTPSDAIKAVAKNDLASLPKVFDLKVNGVGYATSGGKIDAKLQGILEGYKAQIIEGKIKVASRP